MKVFEPGKLPLGRCTVIKRFWVESWRSAFWIPTHNESAAAIAALQAAGSEVARNKSYNISGGEILTYRAMLARIFEVLKLPS
ncbi:MAG: hypothetical protein K2P94_05960, partial [Rhodospirillaceae bacterium]|nr:hypothetical protein [Rhodospirillaceae bacterium]